VNKDITEPGIGLGLWATIIEI